MSCCFLVGSKALPSRIMAGEFRSNRVDCLNPFISHIRIYYYFFLTLYLHYVLTALPSPSHCEINLCPRPFPHFSPLSSITLLLLSWYTRWYYLSVTLSLSLLSVTLSVRTAIIIIGSIGVLYGILAMLFGALTFYICCW